MLKDAAKLLPDQYELFSSIMRRLGNDGAQRCVIPWHALKVREHHSKGSRGWDHRAAGAHIRDPPSPLPLSAKFYFHLHLLVYFYQVYLVQICLPARPSRSCGKSNFYHVSRLVGVYCTLATPDEAVARAYLLR